MSTLSSSSALFPFRAFGERENRETEQQNLKLARLSSKNQSIYSETSFFRSVLRRLLRSHAHLSALAFQSAGAFFLPLGCYVKEKRIFFRGQSDIQNRSLSLFFFLRDA